MTTSIVKSASDATSNVFTTVGTVAQQLTRTVDTAGQALDMLNSFVSTARTKQIARTAVDMESFYDELAETSAMEASRRQRDLLNELNQDLSLKNIFETNHKKYEGVLTSLRNPNPE